MSGALAGRLSRGSAAEVFREAGSDPSKEPAAGLFWHAGPDPLRKAVAEQFCEKDLGWFKMDEISFLAEIPL